MTLAEAFLFIESLLLWPLSIFFAVTPIALITPGLLLDQVLGDHSSKRLPSGHCEHAL
jgi:hypothetical protein